MDGERDRLRYELARLTEIDGISGHEGAVVAYLREQMTPLADRVEVDPMGNLYAVREGGGGPHLAIGAHSDEIGALVSAIEPDGFIRFQPVGGFTLALLPARKVRVRGHRGVIGVRPGHFGPASSTGAPDVNDLFIDLGLESAEEVRALGVRIGDQITWQSELEVTANPDRVVGKAVDNRIGCLVALELLRAVQGQDLAGRLTVFVAVQEEVGLKGARVVAERLRPEVAVVVDTVPCADTPDTRQVRTFPVGIGRGPVIQVSSAANARGFILAEPVRDYLVGLAENAGIPYQLGTFSFGNTDASAIAAVGAGTTAAVTIPRRYSHSPVEMLDLNDVVATRRLCEEVVQHVGEFPRGLV